MVISDNRSWPAITNLIYLDGFTTLTIILSLTQIYPNQDSTDFR